MRRHMRPIHLWEDQISDNLMEKFPDLKRVLGVDHMYPFGMEGMKRSISKNDGDRNRSICVTNILSLARRVEDG